MTCTLLHQYQIFNDTGSLAIATSQGSTQVLNNSNVFVGWGVIPYISEHTENGTLIMQGQFGADSAASSYRAFKANWTGTPDSTPALWTYANTTSSPTTFYTSWNGATEIACWRFYGSTTNDNSSASTALGEVTKTGFETSFAANQFYAWGYVEALASDGSVLSTSPMRQAYVPHQNQTVPNVPESSGTNITAI